MLDDRKEFSSLGFSMSDKAFSLLYMKLYGIGFVERGVYSYIVDFTQDQALDNGLQDYAYPTKVRMIDDGQIAKGTLNKALRKLIEYDVIEERKIPNKRGGRPISAFKPLPLLNPKEFLEKYGDQLVPEKQIRIQKYIERSKGERVEVKSSAKKEEQTEQAGLNNQSDKEINFVF